MRREPGRDIVLCEGRGRAQDQFSTIDDFGNIGCHQRQLSIVPAVGVLDDNVRARRAMLRYLCCIAPPEANLMALQREIARGRERAVAATEHRDLQGASPSEGAGS